MSESTLSVAVVGAGNMAREHIRAFADVPGVRVAGIYSRTRSKAESLANEFSIPKVCNSLAELYETTRAELVVVTVFEVAMNAVSRACFDYPWTALLEKPAGYNLGDAVDILAAAGSKRRRVYVGLNRRFNSSTRAAIEDLAGNPGCRFIHVQDQQSLEVAASIGHPPVVVENWMYANSIHVVDYLLMFGRGRVVSVQPVIPWNPGSPQVVLTRIMFDSGDAGIYEGIWNGPGPWAVTVNTPARRWEMRPLEQAQFQNRGERRLNPVEVHEWDRRFKPGLRLQAQHVVDGVRGLPSDAVTLQQAMETMRLIHAIFGQ